MAINHKSGRVVVELDAELKSALHAALVAEGMSLKQWLSVAAEEFVLHRRQRRIEFIDVAHPPMPAETQNGVEP